MLSSYMRKIRKYYAEEYTKVGALMQDIGFIQPQAIRRHLPLRLPGLETLQTTMVR
jgi:hypothetical protein